MSIGVDFCHSMVETAVKKRAASNSASRVVFATGDAMALPFRDATFDCIVNGFMLRNVADLDTTFRELCRVLKPGGRLVCLDLTPPRGPLRRFFDLYIATFVPLLGRAGRTQILRLSLPLPIAHDSSRCRRACPDDARCRFCRSQVIG